MIPGQADRDALLTGDAPTLLGIPIVITDLPPGQWRLTIPGPELPPDR